MRCTGGDSILGAPHPLRDFANPEKVGAIEDFPSPVVTWSVWVVSANDAKLPIRRFAAEAMRNCLEKRMLHAFAFPIYQLCSFDKARLDRYFRNHFVFGLSMANHESTHALLR